MIDNTMTEEQARAKWCPMVRLTVPSAMTGINRIWQQFKTWAEGKDREFLQAQEDNTKCIGAACAMWRWAYTRQQVPCPDVNNPDFKTEAGGHWCVECEGTNRVMGETSKGYCGLAGAVSP